MPRTPEPDDAALRWDDIDDPSYVDPGRSETGADENDDDLDGDDRRDDEALAARDRAGAQGDTTIGGHPRRVFLATRAVTVVGALLFAAYTLAWIVGVGTLPLSGPTLLLEVLYQFAEFLAIIASGLWFGATVVLTRGRPGARAGWFALGALVLAPWPFVFGVIG